MLRSENERDRRLRWKEPAKRQKNVTEERARQPARRLNVRNANGELARKLNARSASGELARRLNVRSGSGKPARRTPSLAC